MLLCGFGGDTWFRRTNHALGVPSGAQARPGLADGGQVAGGRGWWGLWPQKGGEVGPEGVCFTLSGFESLQIRILERTS